MHRILLVDDEPGILSALRRVFATARPEDIGGEPVSVEAFDDPEAALVRAGEQPFDLVISDYRMPKLSGVEFLAADDVESSVFVDICHGSGLVSPRIQKMLPE